MTIILIYLCLNIVLAATLERNHRSVGTILHAILFTFTALILTLFGRDGVYSVVVRNMIGEEVYNIVLNAVHCTSVFVPFVVVEFVLILQAFIVAWIMTLKLVEYFSEGSRAHEIVPVCLSDLGRTPPRYPFRKLYSLFEVIRC